MSYEPTQWESGDVITSAKLNKLEQGVAGCSFPIIHFTFNEAGRNFVSTETTAEVLAGLQAGIPQIWSFDNTGCIDITPDIAWYLVIGYQHVAGDDDNGFTEFNEIFVAQEGYYYPGSADLSGDHVVVNYAYD